jgi:murein DD-endopeptidase MepM/ murein hydrolase activator NlpD
MSAPRPILPLLVAALVGAAACAGAAAKVPRIVFPVVGKVSFSDDFGDPRWEGGHPGNDILADRGAPVVAAEAGRIVFWTKSASAGCMLYLYGRSGTTYQYIHLNNDLTPKNDNRGSCVAGVSYAPTLRDGQDVKAGDLIGYVGDSGDADGIHPHLHFEIHPDGGAPVSPYKWLKRAEQLPTTTAPVPLALGITAAAPTRARPVD